MAFPTQLKLLAKKHKVRITKKIKGKRVYRDPVKVRADIKKIKARAMKKKQTKGKKTRFGYIANTTGKDNQPMTTGRRIRKGFAAMTGRHHAMNSKWEPTQDDVRWQGSPAQKKTHRTCVEE